MIYAFDPGKMTGWARMIPHQRGTFRSGQMPLTDALHFMYTTITSDPSFVTEVICEDFIITAETVKKSRQYWSLEGLGALRFMCMEYQVPFTVQTPAAAKRFATNEKLKKVGWYRPGKDHANDAARHLMVFGVSNGLLDVNWFRSEED